MRPLCLCGCGQPAPLAKFTDPARGWVKGEPVRFVHGHNARHNRPRYKVDANGCWLWLLACESEGYGRTYWEGSSRGAHKWMWEKVNGPVPSGLHLDHLCRVRRCVNPAHLEPVTCAENARRGVGAKLTPDDVAAIRASDLPARVLGALYGVSRQAINDIQFSRTWVGVGEPREAAA